jgi:hypothetical protein
VKKSKFGSLNFKDYFRGFLMAIGTSMLISLATIFNSGKIPTWNEMVAILLSGLATGIVYLVKNFFTNSNDNFFKSEPK